MNELKKHTHLFYMLTLAASIFGMICDLFLLYIPGIRYEAPGTFEADYHFLLNISYQNLWIGQTLGLVVIPLHIFGFLMIFPLLNKVSIVKKMGVGFLALLLLIYGIHYHGLMLPTAELLKVGENTDWLRLTLKPIETAVVLLFVAISVLLGIEIYQGRTLYPKMSLFFLPLIPYLGLIVLYALNVPGSNALLAMGLNLTFLIFFSYSFFILKR